MPDNAVTAGQFMDDAPSGPAVMPSAGTAASVVALIEDATLLDMLKQAVDGRRRIWRAEDAVHAADLLLAAPSAVLLIDTAKTTQRTADLVERLYAQFPELPIIVAGRLDDEARLGPLISGGTVFRFLHKPVSIERARNFIEAAVRRLEAAPVQHRAGTVPDLLQPPRRPPIRLPRMSLSPRFVRRTARISTALLGFLLLAWGIAELADRQPWRTIVASLPDRPGRPEPTPERVIVRRLVDAAGVALAQGRLVEPPGRNAVELYRAALVREPANAQARQGLARVADRFLEQVEQALLDGDLGVAASALDAARSAAPDHPRLDFLSTQLAEDAQRVRRHAAERAAGQPAAEQALRQRVAALLTVADQRTQAGKLIGGLDSAEAYVLEARQVAPDDAGVRQALNALSSNMLLKAQQAWTDGNESTARNWLQRARALGGDPEGIARLNALMASARMATMVEDRSRLLALANQRLAQGRLLEPATDSARHYLDLLIAADPAFPGVTDTEALLASRLVDEATRLSRDGRPGDAGRYLAAAEAAGAQRADLDAARTAVTGAGAVAEAASRVLPESALQRTGYAALEYPARAAARGIEGWVDVEFTVAADGTTRDAAVLDASPRGAFEDAVLGAVRRWRYEPYRIAGIAVDQRVRLRLRFELADR